jgi:hypothetical protein
VAQHEHQRKHGHKDHHQSGRKRLHSDWRFWLAVVAMLVAMLAYVLSDNESLRGFVGAPKAKSSSTQR